MGIYSSINDINTKTQRAENSMNDLRSLKGYYQGDEEVLLDLCPQKELYVVCLLGENDDEYDVCVEIYL
jgi:hypothetical protein